jgi:LAO/AO transport system kinase
VLLASGLTAQGVPELLAALDRLHDAQTDGGGPRATRLARARAQVEGILADRTRDALWSSHRRAETDALMERVATHEVDPYAAADQLIEQLRSS